MSDGVRANLDLQRALYGELLGDRVRRVVNRYGVSQARIADTVGISPTMLSQVMSGRRAKLANPAVLARLALLERRARVQAPDAQVLAAITAMGASEAVREAALVDEETLVQGLRGCADRAELLACAGAVAPIAPTVARLLARAGSEDRAR